MWEAVRSMTDERTARTWPWHAHQTLERLGMNRVPQHAVVGLLAGRQNEPIRWTICSAETRSSAQASLSSTSMGDVICGQVGDHGVVFLVDYAGSPARTRARLDDVAQRAASAARRFGLGLHAGITGAGDGRATDREGADKQALDAASLPLGVSSSSFGRGRRHSPWQCPSSTASRDPIVQRATSGAFAANSPKASERARNLLSPRFNQYVEAILVHCGYRLEPVRAHLEAGLERLAEPLLATGALDEKSFDELFTTVEREAERAETVHGAGRSIPARRIRHRARGSGLRRWLAEDRGTRRAVAFDPRAPG